MSRETEIVFWMDRFFLVIAAVVLFSSQVWAQGFFAGLPDVPLMPGVVELEARGLSFDKPEGRILVAVASVDDSISDSQLQGYYSQALPAFGWQAVDPFSFVRGHEKLQIVLQNEEGQKLLEITISP